jgi:hypothetical protein
LPPRQLTEDDFYTDGSIVDCARSLFGGIIDLDPASHATANRVVCAKRIYTKEDDGLARPWAGNVWLNPPFSAWREWAPKVSAEWKSGRVQQMCVLAATRSLTAQIFAPVLRTANAVCIFHGRIAFWGCHATPSPDDGHAVFYFGPDVARFRECFAGLGTVYQATFPEPPDVQKSLIPEEPDA